MSDKELAILVCRALLMVVAGIRKKFGIVDKHELIS